MSRKSWAIMRLVLFAAALLAAAVFSVTTYAGALGSEPVTVEVTGVDCPTEDSCTVDYYDGAWHVTEVQP